MALRRKPQRRSARKDPSKFPVPTASVVTPTAIVNGVRITSVDQIVLNPVNDAEPVTGVRMIGAAVDGVPGFAEQVDPNTIDLKFNESGTLDMSPGTLQLDGTMQGMRNIRGGGLIIGQIVFS